MSFLDPPRCPNCYSLIDLAELWRAAPKSRNTISSPVAIVCPVCGVKLRVLQGRSYLIGLLAVAIPFAVMMVSNFVAPVTRRSMDYNVRMGIFAVIVFGAASIHSRNIPRLLTVRLLKDNEAVRYPLAPSTIPEPEASLEGALSLEPTEDGRPIWFCSKCGEENPGNFEECWKCQTWRVQEAGSISRSGPK
jgi:hypothetical protein